MDGTYLARSLTRKSVVVWMAWETANSNSTSRRSKANLRTRGLFESTLSNSWLNSLILKCHPFPRRSTPSHPLARKLYKQMFRVLPHDLHRRNPHVREYCLGLESQCPIPVSGQPCVRYPATCSSGAAEPDNFSRVLSTRRIDCQINCLIA